MGTLYVVGISLASPEDVTLRALRVLREVNLIVARDMASAKRFLACYQIDTPLAGYAGNDTSGECAQGFTGAEPVLDLLIMGDVASLFEVTAGAAAHSTHRLVRAAAERGIAVVSVPGPAVTVTALVTSGLPADAHVSLGFLPQHASERRQLLASLASERRTLVAFETSSRLGVTLHDVAEMLGDRPLALSPLWFKSDEEMWRGTVDEVLVRLEENQLRGDWALVIGGAGREMGRWSEDRVRSELARLLASGVRRKEAARRVAESAGWRPREVYRLATRDKFRL